jgi:formylglycine-generating enzyme required for sulfatase activity
MYDMSGLVYEWCEDVWHDNYQGAPLDGSAWVNGGNQSEHVVRGGSWFSDSGQCHSAFHEKWESDDPEDEIGFRVVRASP